ncbi:hypothetical protein PWT90_01353 [Aphanocladium album]|nr:hypothetical protein PWT90_01353 [Aphanocladium album]
MISSVFDHFSIVGAFFGPDGWRSVLWLALWTGWYGLCLAAAISVLVRVQKAMSSTLETKGPETGSALGVVNAATQTPPVTCTNESTPLQGHHFRRGNQEQHHGLLNLNFASPNFSGGLKDVRLNELGLEVHIVQVRQLSRDLANLYTSSGRQGSSTLARWMRAA